ncbi:MAG TPA: hypothetical protein VI756_28875 [Blastocatellia bacterium]
MSRQSYAAPPALAGIQQRSLVVGVVAIVLCAVVGFIAPRGNYFFSAYLIAYLFLFGLTIGSLAILMMQYMTGGDWGIVIRRNLEAATRTLPLLALAFVPILVGIHTLYPWTDATFVNAPGHEVTKHKVLYLNVPFFIGRAIFYFAVWSILTYFLNKWSREQDESADGADVLRRLQVLSGPGLVLYGLTVSFAGIDWIMSLEPEWFSTIYGMLLMAGQALTALSLMILTLVYLSKREPLSSFIIPKYVHDLGKLLLAFVMIWAYLSFSQLLIVWAGDLPNEIPWYLRRLQTNWQWIGLLLAVFGFAFPFCLLLSRDLKRRANTIIVIAIILIVLRFVDLFWLTAPELSPTGLPGEPLSYLMDVLAPIGLGGIWLAYYIRELRARPLLPLGDPYMDVTAEHVAEYRHAE